MTLRQILTKGVYHSIFNVLHKHYCRQESDHNLMELAMIYRKVRDELLSLPLNEEPEGYILIKSKDNEVEDVLIKDKDEIFAADFVEWGNLIDREVIPDSSYKGNIAEMAAHILWEITFYGYSWDDIASRKAEINEATKNYKNDPHI